MLETVREYGQERLEASGEGDATRDRLAKWCLALAEEVRPDVNGGEMQPRSVERFHEELPNVRAAVTWLLDHGEATPVLRLLAATEDYWTQRHLGNAELRRWLKTALAAAPDAPASDRALAHWLLASWGHSADADEHAQHMFIAAQESGEPFLLALGHYAVGRAWDSRGDLDRAAAAYAEAISLLRSGGYEAHACVYQAYLATTLVLRGDLDAGVPMLDEALTRLREISSDWFVVLVIAQRGHAALRQGDLPGAARWFTETIDLARTLQHTATLLSAVTGLAGVALALGQAERAARLLGAVEAAREALGLAQIHNAHHAERITADTVPPWSRQRSSERGDGPHGAVGGGSGRGARRRRRRADRGEGKQLRA